MTQYYFKVYQILKQEGIIRSQKETRSVEELLAAEFRKPIDIDQFYIDYQDGKYTGYFERKHDRDKFSRSLPWITLKKEVNSIYPNKCMCCGKKGTPKEKLQCDHIKPKIKYPTLALEIRNIQLLCPKCNWDKSYTSEQDYRTEEHIAMLEDYIKNKK